MTTSRWAPATRDAWHSGPKSRAAGVARSRVTDVTSPRQAQPSTLRRASKIVLISGTVIAVAAAFGPTWLVRVGVAVAIAAAILACVLAWRELFSAERRHAAQQLAATRAHGAALTQERTRNGEVVDTLTRRVREVSAVVETQNTVIANLRGKVSTLNGDRAHLRSEIGHRDTVITSLRETVRSREAELIALRDTSDDADIHHMPRRVLAEHESSWAELPDADELWNDGSHPTVVDLKMIDTAMVLPNYEVDRKVG
jgi:hypothetical protein